jgi:subtilisin family serine protease
MFMGAAEVMNPSKIYQIVRYLLPATGLLWSTLPLAAPPSPQDEVATHIVVYRSGVDPDNVTNEFVATHGLRATHVFRYAIKGAAVVVPPGRLAAFQRDPRVDYVEANQVFRATAQTLPTGVSRINADIDLTAKIDGVDERVNADIAILDSGIDLTHPDLYVYRYTNCTVGTVNKRCVDNDSGANDGYGHGTHVAGTAAALDNGTSVVGVAPGARLWAVKVLDNTGNGTTGSVIAGIDYVTAHASEIDVANMSLGCVCTSSAMNTAVSNSVAAGVVYTISAGNDMLDVANVTPANNPSAIIVSALADFDGKHGGLSNASQAYSICTENRDDSFACFSNFGSGVTIMAPGVNILSTWTGGGSAILGGTSMASPHVAGAAALYRVKHPGSTPTQVKAGLLAEADPAPCANSSNGHCSDDPDGIQEPLVMMHGPDGDVAPLGNTDGKADIADYLVLLRIVQGRLTPSAQELVHGDLYPPGAPDGVLDIRDLLLMLKMVK